MVSPRRSTGGDGSNRTPAARDPGAPPPLSPARRAGVVVIVGALAVSILLALGGGSTPPVAPPFTPGPGQTAGAAGSPGLPTPLAVVPAVVPVIVPPANPLLMDREWTASVTIPDPGVPLRTLELWVYRNERRVMDPIRVRSLTMSVRKIPLKRGENRIAVSLANAGGEGQRSEAVVLTVDDEGPVIDVREPADEAVVNGQTVTVRGITEPGLEVTVTNAAVSAVQPVTSDDRGIFITEIRLGPDENQLAIEASDAAGNQTRETITVTRGDGQAKATLSITPHDLRLADLPTSLDVRLVLTDPDGAPVDGAAVTFSVSPPGWLSTETYDTVTVDGVARWEDVLIAREGAVKGNGFVTVRAILGEGIPPAIATKPLEIR
jgi:hypothetical protein